MSWNDWVLLINYIEKGADIEAIIGLRKAPVGRLQEIRGQGKRKVAEMVEKGKAKKD